MKSVFIRPLALAAGLSALAGWAQAGEIRVMCYQDGVECEVTAELAKRFEAQNPGTKVIVDTVPYKSIVEQLPVQLAAGQGPDIARVTDLGGLSKYYMDISAHIKNRKYWDDNFGATAPWLRPTAGDKGIYGFMSQLTMTGPFVNKTLFEQAKVPMPGAKATWDDWMEASRKVAKATQIKAAAAWDRSGHRFAGPAISYGAKIFESIAECIEISKESAVPLHLTHCHLNAPMYHGRANELLKLLDDASRQGIDISLDTYPYTSGSSYLHMMLPSWVQAGGIEQLQIRLREPEVQKKVIDALDHTGSDGNHGGVVNWDNVVIAGVEKAENKKFVGIAISKLAVSQNKLASQLYIDLVLSENCKASMVVFGGNEENVRTIMKDSRHTVGSDGILHGDRPHPRAYGTFARFLGHYSRDEQMFPLEGAINRMTGRPAMRLGLQDRGFIREGYKADLVLFDHESVADRSTFESPRLPASGFEYVWINGIPTLEKGERTNLVPGKGIRKTSLTHQGGNNGK